MDRWVSAEIEVLARKGGKPTTPKSHLESESTCILILSRLRALIFSPHFMAGTGQHASLIPWPSVWHRCTALSGSKIKQDSPFDGHEHRNDADNFRPTINMTYLIAFV